MKHMVGRRRPGTAGRKVGKPKSLMSNQAVTVYAGNQQQQPLQVMPQISNSKAISMELEVHKLRPQRVLHERERLYDDVMKQRMTANNLRDDNIKLRTRLQMTENELARKDKMIDELLLLQQEA